MINRIRKICNFIKEDYITSLPSEISHDMNFDVYKNPTNSEFRQLIKDGVEEGDFDNYKEFIFRFVLDTGNGDLYLWRARHSTHSYLTSKLKLKGRSKYIISGVIDSDKYNRRVLFDSNSNRIKDGQVLINQTKHAFSKLVDLDNFQFILDSTELKEDYSTDKEARAEGNRIITTLEEALRTIHPNGVRETKVDGFPSILVEFGYYNNRYPKLKFLFVGGRVSPDRTHLEKTHVSFSFSPGNSTIYIPVNTILTPRKELKSDWGDDWVELYRDKLDELANTVRRNSDKILHELTHFFDEERYTKSYKDNYNSPDIKKDDDLETKQKIYFDYLNQPSEYNAYLQMALDRVDRQINRFLLAEKGNEIYQHFQTFDDFLDIYSMWSKIKLNRNYLTDEYLRKTRKRLYQYYVNKKKEIEDLLNDN